MRTAAWFVLALGLAAGAQTMTDDFGTRPDGAVLELPGWDLTSIGWEMHDGALTGDGGALAWQAAPFGRVITFSCDVTPLEIGRGDWHTCGIALAADERNYWAMHLVQAPETQDSKRYAELEESLGGNWLASGQPGSFLPKIPDANYEGLAFELGVTYRMSLALTADQIVAEISQGGTLLARFGNRLTPGVDAVRTGRPVLRASAMKARFANLQVTATETATPPADEVEAPAWVSRPGEAIAPAAGFFRPVEVDGRWWLVDPEGKPFYVVGTDHARYTGHWCEKLGYAPYGRKMKARFPNEDDWAAETAARLLDWNFNTLGTAHSASLQGRGLPYMLMASMGSTFADREWLCEKTTWTGFPDVFSPSWPLQCKARATQVLRHHRNNPWLIGTFFDNELEWYGKRGFLVDEVFQRGPEVAGKQALYDWLLERYGTIAQVNQALGTQYADRADFLATTSVPIPSDALTNVRNGFLTVIAERYFSAAAQAMREVDPNHLNLGARFAGRVPEAIREVAGKYCDVFTINTYPRVDFLEMWTDELGGTVQDTPQMLNDLYAAVGRPMIITEWSFPAMDSGLPNTAGAGMRVDTQAQKATCYRLFANMIAEQPFMVGYNYFMWVDEPELGVSYSFPEDSNYGLVNEENEPYTELVTVAQEVNAQAAARHERSRYSGLLEMSAAEGGVRVTNPAAITSLGALWLGNAEERQILPLELAPGASQLVPVPREGLWQAELQRWDGTKQRLAGGAPRTAGQAVNASATELTDVPVVLDTTPPRAALVRQWAPGQAIDIPAAGAPRTVTEPTRLTGTVANWLLAGTDGSLFDDVRAGDLPLGKVIFAIHERIAGLDQWVSADTVESAEIREVPDGWVIDALVARGRPGEAITAVNADGVFAPATAEPPTWRALVRAVVFRETGLAMVRPLWVESTDHRPFELVDLFVFCRSAIGGDIADDALGGAGVPAFYLSGQYWSDTQLGGLFGVVAPVGTWHLNYWLNASGGQHPDAWYLVEETLAPQQRYEVTDVPYLWVLASQDATGWRTPAVRVRQSGMLLLPGR